MARVLLRVDNSYKFFNNFYPIWGTKYYDFNVKGDTHIALDPLMPVLGHSRPLNGSPNLLMGRPT